MARLMKTLARMETRTGDETTRLEADLRTRLSRVTSELAGLNRELAAQMVMLASQTGDPKPLIGAVQALTKVRDHYSSIEAPVENLDVHEELATTLLALGRARGDVQALEHSVLSFRSAITLASLVGDDAARRRLRAGHAEAHDALSARGGYVPAKRVA